MTKGVYVGVNGVAHKVKKAYIGVGGVARKIKKIYIGVNGIARLAWTGGAPAGQVIFTSSQTWTVPEGVSVIDIFCVGGGGGCGLNSDGYPTGGAGGGYTAAKLGQTVTPGTTHSVVVGAGGVGYVANAINAVTGDGKPSSFGSLLIANGGIGSFWSRGANGGSGGGAAAVSSTNNVGNGGNGGSDGSDGYPGTTLSVFGLGQHTTTRAFGEGANTLYAGGGGGAAYKSQTSQTYVGGVGGAGGGGSGGFDGYNYPMATNGTPNTGGGAGGANQWNNNNPKSGGSGIVIIRWSAQ